MKFHQLRNATAILELGPHRLLIDPMLGPAGGMPGFKMFGGGRRPNPLVPLPPDSEAALATVSGVLITHEHPDHLDPAGLAWIRARGLPVWATGVDVANLRKKGLDARLLEDGALGARVEVFGTRHGRGLLGWLMGPVSGVFLAHPEAPSVLLTGDAILTEALLATVARLQPDVLVAPAGAANVGLGGDILFSVDELLTLAAQAPGAVVFNHLEALDHCPTTRAALRARLREAGLGDRCHVPEDGEVVSFEGVAGPTPELQIDQRRPGLHKRVTARLAGT